MKRADELKSRLEDSIFDNRRIQYYDSFDLMNRKNWGIILILCRRRIEHTATRAKKRITWVCRLDFFQRGRIRHSL